MLPKIDEQEALERFFTTFWKDTESHVYLATKDNENNWKKFFFEWPEGKEVVAEWVLQQSASGKDVYFGPALYKEPTEATKENILGSWTYWSEWDGLAPTWDVDGAGRAASGPLKGIPAPSIRVQSSARGHEHLYWLLEEFQDNPEVIERVNRTITYAGGADKGCWNANRVLRPPGTVNTGYGKDREQLPVHILETNKSFVTSRDFDILPPPKKVTADEIQQYENLPSLDKVKALYEWTSDLYSIFEQDSPKTGDRSSAMVRIAMMCAEQGFSEEAIFVVLRDVDDRWGKYKDRKDRDVHLIKMVDRAKTKHPHGIAEEVWSTTTETNKKSVYGFRDLLRADIHIDWLIKDLLPRKGMGIIAAAPGVGKTLMAVDMAINMALGREYLNWVIEDEIKVLFLSLEMPEAPFQYFQAHVAQALSEEELDRLNVKFLIAPLGEMLLLNEPGEVYLNHLLSTYSPDVVIVDSLSQMLVDMQDDKAARSFMSRIKKFGDIYDTAFMFVHHNRKPSENKPSTQADMFGSVFIASNVDFIISLWKDQDHSKAIRFAMAKNRLADTGQPMLAIRGEDLRYELRDEYPVDITRGGEDTPHSGTSLSL